MKIITTDRNRVDLLATLPKNSICAELGVFRGDYSEEIVKHAQPKTLYLVDIFDGVMRSGDRNGENVFPIDMREEFDRVRERFKAHPGVQVIRFTSWDWLFKLPAGVLDWVYIDTDHNYETTVRELAGSWQAVRPGGFICGHDYSQQYFPGVVRAVNELAQSHSLTVEVFSGDKLPSFKLIRQDQAGRD
jgi:hypothetical protein